VFGCGGERDTGKRAEMGRIAEYYAARVVLTDDNPRREDPMGIIIDIQHGMGDADAALVIADREQAIRHAIAEARPEDIVLVAGKGHEDYQERGGIRRAFSDRAVVRRCLAGLQA
jgi:UDP-N-acetylmuramyl tripeptide synthase